MEMKRQEHTIHSKRHVSPHVLSTVYCGESTNATATLPSRGLALVVDNIAKYFKEHHFHRKKMGKKIKKVIDFEIFLAITVT